MVAQGNFVLENLSRSGDTSHRGRRRQRLPRRRPPGVLWILLGFNPAMFV